MAFLGEVGAARVASLSTLSLTCERHSLPIEVARYWARNRVVWAGPRKTPGPVQALVDSLRAELRAGGFRVEDRAFAAHITLIRKAIRGNGLSPLPTVRWPVEEYVLVRSRPAAKGSDYEVIGRFPLR